MTDDRFRELVNLYLDKEIAREDLAELREELKLNRARRMDFEERCRLHQAMALALAPKGETKTASLRRSSASSSHSFGERRMRRRTNPLKLPLLVLGSSSFAVIVIAAFIFNPVVREIMRDDFMRGGEASGVVGDEGVGAFDSKRYESARGDFQGGAAARENSSLTAQLRLAGLGPETSPTIANLRRVELVKAADAEAGVPDIVRQMEADFYGVSQASIMESESVISGRHNEGGFWPDGFKSSLAGY